MDLRLICAAGHRGPELKLTRTCPVIVSGYKGRNRPCARRVFIEADAAYWLDNPRSGDGSPEQARRAEVIASARRAREARRKRLKYHRT